MHYLIRPLQQPLKVSGKIYIFLSNYTLCPLGNRKGSLAVMCDGRSPAIPAGSSVAGMVLQSCSELGYRGQIFGCSHWLVFGWGFPGKEHELASEAIPQKAWCLEAHLTAEGMSSAVAKGVWMRHQSTHYGGSNKLVCSQSEGTKSWTLKQRNIQKWNHPFLISKSWL